MSHRINENCCVHTWNQSENIQVVSGYEILCLQFLTTLPKICKKILKQFNFSKKKTKQKNKNKKKQKKTKPEQIYKIGHNAPSHWWTKPKAIPSYLESPPPLGVEHGKDHGAKPPQRNLW